MISSIKIQNFRCFRNLKIDSCRPLNIIVGENGVGKTSILEAIFITLGNSPKLALGMRQRRGLEGSFQGDHTALEETLWGDLLFDWDLEAKVQLVGDGFENRTLSISRSPARGKSSVALNTGSSTRSGQIRFRYTDNTGRSIDITPSIVDDKIEMLTTGEQIPLYYSFSANHSTGSGEMATRFSRLRMSGTHNDFTEFLTQEYPFLSDLSVESLGGAPVLTAVVSRGRRLPLHSISGGISKLASVALAMFARRGGIVMIDEIENGLYYKHYEGVWGGLLRLAEATNTQLFVSTHSGEALAALNRTSGATADRLALWRVRRAEDGSQSFVQEFSGRDLLAAIEFESEVR